MTGAEHKAAAERLMAEHLSVKSHGGWTITPVKLTMPAIHAILALEAAVRGEPWSSEVTRAGDVERERYIDHLSTLYARGFVTEREAEELRRRILETRSLALLESVLYGFPQPEPPVRPRPKFDWGIPENFVPPAIGVGAIGLMIAVIAATALAHRGDTLSNVLSAVSIITGLLIVFAAIVVAIWAGCSWEDTGPSEREIRRADRKRR